MIKNLNRKKLGIWMDYASAMKNTNIIVITQKIFNKICEKK